MRLTLPMALVISALLLLRPISPDATLGPPAEAQWRVGSYFQQTAAPIDRPAEQVLLCSPLGPPAGN